MKNIGLISYHLDTYPNYVNAIEAAGGTDINPALYQAKNTASFGIDDTLDNLEWQAASLALDKQLPLQHLSKGTYFYQQCPPSGDQATGQRTYPCAVQ